MSFVIGFMTGMTTGEVVERRKAQSQFREYLERRGYTIVDRQGQVVPFDRVIDETTVSAQQSRKTLAVVGVIAVGALVIAGGSGLVLLAMA